MNPVLLKPQSDVGAQLIVRGRMVGAFDASAFARDKSGLLDVAMQSYRNLASEAQLMIVEGAGSPAETNLRRNDIANMGLARALGLPVVLVGDINRGHVIASLVGAQVVLDEADRVLIRGFIVNKFRGRAELFDEGVRQIAGYTGWPCIGVVPWLRAAARLPSEDGMQLEEVAASRQPGARVRIAVPQLSRIANFDDFDPLREEPEVELVFVPPGRPIPRDATLIVIPGTKATIADMEFMRAQGWDVDILAHVRHGGRALGICGGYQMLGTSISDPDGIEGPPRTVAGLGLLDVQTVMQGDKTLREVSGVFAEGGDARFAGYEMHVGSTTGPGARRPFLQFNNGAIDGAVSADGRVAGCYVHGLFGVTAARASLVSSIGATPGHEEHSVRVDMALDEIAGVLEGCLDISKLAAIAGL